MVYILVLFLTHDWKSTQWRSWDTILAWFLNMGPKYLRHKISLFRFLFTSLLCSPPSWSPRSILSAGHSPKVVHESWRTLSLMGLIDLPVMTTSQCQGQLCVWSWTSKQPVPPILTIHGFLFCRRVTHYCCAHGCNHGCFEGWIWAT